MKVKAIASIAALASVLVCTAAEHQVVWLDELPLDGMTSGWREPIKGKSVEGNPLQIGAKTFERGVGTHAKSLAVFRVDGKAVAFDADVGIDAEAFADGSNAASLKFIVKADGRTVAETLRPLDKLGYRAPKGYPKSTEISSAP